MTASDLITLQVNGQSQTCRDRILLPEMLVELGLNPRLVAVEYNGTILHRQFWSETPLKAGDRLEIVTIVGGGSDFTPKNKRSNRYSGFHNSLGGDRSLK